jgi:CYTH domain-containing protein
VIVRGGEDEARPPKYAHIERERRFLVDPGRRPELAGLPFVLIEDRYIQGTRLRLRRMLDSADGRCVLKLTKKYEAEDPLVRPIVTVYLNEQEYRAISALPARLLAKRRYPICVASVEFGLDVFLEPLVGLELAEIECADDAELRAIARPEWVLSDVSYDPQFQGGNLAALGAEGLAALLCRTGESPVAPKLMHNAPACQHKRKG